MSQTVKAIYENGVFKPLQKVNIKPHQKAKLVIFPEEELSSRPENVKKSVKSQKKLTEKYASYYQTLSLEEEKEISSLEEDFACADAETENILKGQAE